MERFELSIVAQGSQSVWVASLAIALLCVTVISLAAALWSMRRLGFMPDRRSQPPQ
jgi:hypothetical protein